MSKTRLLYFSETVYCYLPSNGVTFFPHPLTFLVATTFLGVILDLNLVYVSIHNQFPAIIALIPIVVSQNPSISFPIHHIRSYRVSSSDVSTVTRVLWNCRRHIIQWNQIIQLSFAKQHVEPFPAMNDKTLHFYKNEGTCNGNKFFWCTPYSQTKNF